LNFQMGFTLFNCVPAEQPKTFGLCDQTLSVREPQHPLYLSAETTRLWPPRDDNTRFRAHLLITEQNQASRSLRTAAITCTKRSLLRNNAVAAQANVYNEEEEKKYQTAACDSDALKTACAWS